MSDLTVQNNKALLTDIYDEKQLELSFKAEQLNLILNQPPNPQWVKKHPYIKDYNYLPIDKVEFLLRKIFKRYKIEILKTNQLFNAIEVNVRVHFFNPVFNDWDFHDGCGAQELQTMKDTGSLKLDMSNINRGAVTMALPIAKSVAIKDACDHFGDLFGANLNRKDTLNFSVDKNLNTDEILKNLKELYELKKDSLPPEEQVNFERIINDKEKKSYKKAINYLACL